MPAKQLRTEMRRLADECSRRMQDARGRALGPRRGDCHDRSRRRRSCSSCAGASTSSRLAQRKIAHCTHASASCRSGSKLSARSRQPSPTFGPRWPESTPAGRRTQRSQVPGSTTSRAPSTRSPASSCGFGSVSITPWPAMPRRSRPDSTELRAGSSSCRRSTRGSWRSRTSWSRGRTGKPSRASPPSFEPSLQSSQPDP